MDEEEARLRLSTLITSALGPGKELSGKAFTQSVEEAVDELLPLWRTEQSVARTPLKIGALLPFRYVIPDQDLKLVDTAFSALTAFAAAGYFMPQMGFDPVKSPAAAITGITVAVLRLLQNLKLAVHLENCDFAIVAALAGTRENGLSVQLLLKMLRASFTQLTAEDLEHRLQALTACANASGTKSALVWKDGNGIWHSNGV